METLEITTEFAPAERESIRIVELQSKVFAQNRLLTTVANAVSEMLVVLNDKRQIIYSNEVFNKTIGQKNGVTSVGKRVGEAVNCIHAFKTKGGCGTTEFCKTCGAVNAIIEAQTANKSEKECRILTLNNDALDLRVKATLFHADNEKLTIFTLNDISSEKRKQTLERVFFHDVLNSAGGISGLSGLMPEINDPNEMMEVAEMINRATENLINEIQAQRYLIAAENGDLTVEKHDIESFKILKDLADLYSKHEIVTDKYISIHKESENITFKTDSVLLRRIIGNMIKNALEASMPASIVTISSKKDKEIVRFSVHNGTYIPREIQLQLFQRSFTTKGIGRGIGTYSMKLLGEKYLKGKVSFESSPEKGTTFYIEV
jgi:nitrogen fixation/metabolism regulation signal transduction histidine kinase